MGASFAPGIVSPEEEAFSGVVGCAASVELEAVDDGAEDGVLGAVCGASAAVAAGCAGTVAGALAVPFECPNCVHAK